MRRIDHLMAQRVDVAIVFRDMLGAEDALSYMAGCSVPAGVVARVLAGLAVTRIAARAAAHGATDDEPSERGAANWRTTPVDLTYGGHRPDAGLGAGSA